MKVKLYTNKDENSIVMEVKGSNELGFYTVMSGITIEKAENLTPDDINTIVNAFLNNAKALVYNPDKGLITSNVDNVLSKEEKELLEDELFANIQILFAGEGWNNIKLDEEYEKELITSALEDIEKLENEEYEDESIEENDEDEEIESSCCGEENEDIDEDEDEEWDTLIEKLESAIEDKEEDEEGENEEEEFEDEDIEEGENEEEFEDEDIDESIEEEGEEEKEGEEGESEEEEEEGWEEEEL